MSSTLRRWTAAVLLCALLLSGTSAFAAHAAEYEHETPPMTAYGFAAADDGGYVSNWDHLDTVILPALPEFFAV